MRTIKYLFMLLVSVSLMTSCFPDATELDLNDEGSNVAGFEESKTAFAAIADGVEYGFVVEVKLVGPTAADLTSDITVTYSASEASTAIEGTHYRIETPTIVLKKSNNYLGKIEITMITDGIETPLDESPVLYLETSPTGDATVVSTGKPLPITFNYACPSFLAGDYNAVYNTSNYGTYDRAEGIIEVGIGSYITEFVGAWGQLNGAANDGFGHGVSFTDVCDVITVPSQGLADYYSNNVFGHLLGSVDDDGVITMYYTVEPSYGTFEVIYTPITK